MKKQIERYSHGNAKHKMCKGAVQAVWKDSQNKSGSDPSQCHRKIQELKAKLGMLSGIVATIQGGNGRVGSSDNKQWNDDDDPDLYPPYYNYESDVWSNEPHRLSPYTPHRCMLKQMGGDSNPMALIITIQVTNDGGNRAWTQVTKAVHPTTVKGSGKII